MSAARVAAARAKVHEAIDELFDAIFEARARQAPEVVEEPQPINDLDKARARKVLRKMGVDV